MAERKFRVIFSDIDGTLLNSEHKITAETLREIRRLHRAGIPFVPVSARMPSGIRPICAKLGFPAPMICYSGGLVLDTDGREIFSRGFPAEAAREIFRLAAEHTPAVSVSAYRGDCWLAPDPQNPWILQERDITGTEPVPAAAEFLEGDVHKLLCMGDPGEILAFSDLLKVRFPALSVYRSKETYLEIMSGDASKSAAIRFLCAGIGCTPEQAVSFGDNYNDIDMLRATGLGVAMGNAPDPVKQHADVITGDNNSDGIATVLRTILG